MSSDFVRAEGTRLMLGDRPFYFVGANSYDLMANAGYFGPAGFPVPQVTDLLDECQRMGLTVVRTWAFFNKATDDRNQAGIPKALEYQPGVYNEDFLRGLDYVIAEAGQRGIKLLLVLTNYWEDYGGMREYANWALRRNDRSSEDFYTSPDAIRMFENHVRKIVTRPNSFTGIEYRDDPTIMAWSVCNEPRYKNPLSGESAELEAFLRSACQLVKDLDKNHLVTHGSEGFYGKSDRDLLEFPDSPYNTFREPNNEGCDFRSHYNIPEADFTCIHLWPEDWGVDGPDRRDRLEEFNSRWILKHAEISAELGKPFVVTEFGSKRNDELRRRIYNQVLNLVYGMAADPNGDPVMGMLCWNLTVKETNQVGEYDVYPPGRFPRGARGREINDEVMAKVEEKAGQFNDLREQGSLAQTPAVPPPILRPPAVDGRDFVRVDGSRLVLGDETFYFIGANSYDLMMQAAYWRASGEPVRQVTDLLDKCVEMGLTVVRMWAFFNEPTDDRDQRGTPKALEYQPGVYNEDFLWGLDYVISEAGKRDIKLLPVLTNYQKEYGGMRQYANWALRRTNLRSEDFYTSPDAIRMFENHVRKIVTRRNSITGVNYSDDPTIMAWSICNEPRYRDSPSGESAELESFIRRACRLVKDLDKNHLVTHGSEGFYGKSDPHLAEFPDSPYNTFTGTREGCDFRSHYNIPEADFTCIHMWIEDWGIHEHRDKRDRMDEFNQRWIAKHAEISRELGKPFVVTEFGTRWNDELRRRLYRQVLNLVHDMAADPMGDPVMGLLIWNLTVSDSSAGRYNVFPLGMFPPGASGREINDEVMRQVMEKAEQFKQLRQSSGGAVPGMRSKIVARGGGLDDQFKAPVPAHSRLRSGFLPLAKFWERGSQLWAGLRVRRRSGFASVAASGGGRVGGRGAATPRAARRPTGAVGLGGGRSSAGSGLARV